jgi:hypothetical protein
MEALGMTTPALLFPAISLLLLAYTNRFLVIANLIRALYKQYHETADSIMRAQIENLQRRIKLIRTMQLFSVLSFICCTVSMALVLINLSAIAAYVFGVSLALLTTSLVICFIEIYISGGALQLQLDNLGALHTQGSSAK